MKKTFLAAICLCMLGFFASAQAQNRIPIDASIFNNALKQLQKTVSLKPRTNSVRKTPKTAPTAPKSNVSRTTSARNPRPSRTTSTRRSPTKKDARTTDIYTDPDDAVDNIEDSSAVALADTAYRSTPGIILVEKMFPEANANNPQINFYKNIITRGWMDYQTASQTKGYQYNDIARAAAYFIATNYNVYHNNQMFTPELTRGLYNQMKQQLGSNPDLAKMKDEDKQVFSELLVFLTTVPGYANDIGVQQQNSNLLNQSREMAKQNIETLLGIPIDKIAFNENGLTQR